MFKGKRITGIPTKTKLRDCPPCVTIHNRGEGRFTSSFFRTYPDVLNGGTINIEWDKKLLMLRFNFDSGSSFTNSSFNVVPGDAKEIIKYSTKVPLVQSTLLPKSAFLITHRDDLYWYAKPCDSNYKVRPHYDFEHLSQEEQTFWVSH